MIRFSRWLFCLLFVTRALLAQPLYAQPLGPLTLQADSSRFPEITVTVTLSCAELTSVSQTGLYQIQEDGAPISIQAPQSFTETKPTQTAILLDLWQGSASNWDKMRTNLLDSLLASNKLNNGQDKVAIFVPENHGKQAKEALALTADGGVLHNAVITQTVTNLNATALISLTRQILPGLDQTGAVAKSIVILSDGTDPISKGLSKQLIDDAKAQGVKIYTVFVPDSYQNKALLEQLANETGGKPHQKSELGLLWGETLTVTQPMCRFTYRTERANPKQLTLHSQLLDPAQKPVAYAFTSHAVSQPKVQITARPEQRLEQGIQATLPVTVTTTFTPFTDLNIQRIEYGIVDHPRLQWQRTNPPWNVIDLPLSGLPAGNYTVFIRVFDELGQEDEQKMHFTLNPPPAVAPSPASSIPTSSSSIITTVAPTAGAPPQEPVTRGPSMAEILRSRLENLFKTLWATRWQWLPWLITLLSIALLGVVAWRNRRKRRARTILSASLPFNSPQHPAVLKRLSLDLDQPEVIPLREKHTSIKGFFLISAEIDDYYLAPESDAIVIIKRNPSTYQIGEPSVEQSVKYPERVRLTSGQIIKAGEKEFVFYIIQRTTAPLLARSLT